MPMTKAEKAALEAAHVRAALSWPSFEEPKALTLAEVKAEVTENPASVKTSYDQEIRAGKFWTQTAFSSRVKCVYCDGQLMFCWPPGDVVRLDSRWESVKLYRTHEDARRALAWKTARQCAAKLRAVEMLEELAL